MELLDAMEEMEERASGAGSTAAMRPPVGGANPAGDFLDQQVRVVQRQLKDAWRLKHKCEAVVVPFYWVLAKLVRLVEEYPDGLTEAVVLTELMAQLNQRIYRSNSTGGKNAFRIKDTEDMSEFLLTVEGEALCGTITAYDQRRLTLDMEQSNNFVLYMYLHQRYRSCLEYIRESASIPDKSFPFNAGRSIAFTNAKLLERKDVDIPGAAGTSDRFTLLPTSFLALQLKESDPIDQQWINTCLNLHLLDNLVLERASTLQQLCVKAKVLDIGAIRACKSPLHIQRQVILLGEASRRGTDMSASERRAQASHMMILWDDQVTLSRLFRVGDTVVLFHPYVHVGDPNDIELQHILSEFSLQQDCQYYFEYGTATTLFCIPATAIESRAHTAISGTVQDSFKEREHSIEQLGDIQPGWTEFSLCAFVLEVKVSHGIPLLAAYFHTYYDSKTNRNVVDRGHQQAPQLDELIVSKYYLVTLLQLYLPGSKRMISVEVTGGNALRALRVLPGQCVFFDGLVSVDLNDDQLRSQRGQRHNDERSLGAEPAFAFADKDYGVFSPVVVLCSDWATIFGNQSMFQENSKLAVMNSMPGLLATDLLPQPASIAAAGSVGVKLSVECVTSIGWLVPSSNSGGADDVFACDRSCERGFATMFAHKPCGRALTVVSSGKPLPNGSSQNTPPKWKCDFCCEIFSGMEDISESYCEVVMTIESCCESRSPLRAVCAGETIEALLGLPAQEYAQLRLTEKRAALERSVGCEFRMLISHCVSRIVSNGGSGGSQRPPSRVCLRIDQLQPVDSYAASRRLLQELRRRSPTYI